MRIARYLPAFIAALLAQSGLALPAEPIPHGQTAPPGPALTPEQAVAKMTVPEGFSVEVVAAEPDLVNPVAMTFDEKGRIWVTESLEYPRREPGPGRDRIKVLEDTDGDGKADKSTIFAEGLNIPSGIAVGYGGVWVANAPDILFLRDTDGDGKADTREVVVTGFGRDDTHELPNSLTWGPDGFLYGLNGVFNPSHVEQNGHAFDFTCAVFRINPRTREFSLFAEGTSNPWGIALDGEGSMFLSACVIDHLWHIAETGYYHRQGGPYPPYTWKIGSIVKHKHQKAAYCGIQYFDSDAYPEEYRGRLYMGNIHGNCVNVDALERDGSTYFGTGRPDFLSANDAWFMTVSQKVGPDGCLYVLDWYDRYHCYQDANRDPQGIDRLKGRLYRVRYKETPRAPRFDLSAESDDELIRRLASPNIYFRDIAQRLLAERAGEATRERLERLVLDETASRKTRMHALWALVGGGTLRDEFQLALLGHADPGFRAWGVRAAGNAGTLAAAVREKVAALAADESPDVRLQVAVAANKVEGLEPVTLLTAVFRRSGDDTLIPHIVWQNLHPLLRDPAAAASFASAVGRARLSDEPGLAAVVPRALDRILGAPESDLDAAATLLAKAAESNPAAAAQGFALMASRIQSGQLDKERTAGLRKPLDPALKSALSRGEKDPLYFDAALLAATVGMPEGLAAVRRVFESGDQSAPNRAKALDALIASGDKGVLAAVTPVLGDRERSPLALRAQVLASLGRLDEPAVAPAVLKAYPEMEAELQPKAIELLTQRTAWARDLLAAVNEKTVPAGALNVNQIRRLLGMKDQDLVDAVRRQWGTVREERDPGREKLIAETRALLRSDPGDARKGQAVFTKVCAQCHKIYGEGQEVGPDITSNGRASFDQLLSNVLDPSLVVGAAYQSRTVVTTDGRVLNGLVVEDNDERIVLKIQGGKLETIARGDVEETALSKLSLMPEGLEKQLQPRELADLFAFLTLTRPPGDLEATEIPGTRPVEPRSTSDPAEYDEILQAALPGFSVKQAGDGGLALLREHLGREGAVQTHPVSREKPCVLTYTAEVPKDRPLRLSLSVSHHPQGNWRLVVKGNGETLHDGVVGPETTINGWADLSVDLNRFAGQTVKLELQNVANDWSWEYGYWGGARLVEEK